jgi:hypothetical protein
VKASVHGAIGRIAGLFVALCAFAPQPAAAQGLFDSLFGRPRYIQPQLPPQTSSYADPFGFGHREPRRHSEGPSYGYGTAYCVRTCDGRYFPLQRHSGMSPAELCQSFCPASKTMVFTGSKIDHAVASNGTRYADLDNAFTYRDKVIDNCTCNGKDALGLARLSTTADPTLRPGDIVATNDGLVSFRGRGSRSTEFTPVDTSSGALAQRLAGVKILPAPPAQKIEVAPEETKQAEKPRRKERRRVQTIY